MPTFNLDYDSMKQFDDMPAEQQSAAWGQLSPAQQEAVTNYHPHYMAEKATRSSRDVVNAAVVAGKRATDPERLENQRLDDQDTTDVENDATNKKVAGFLDDHITGPVRGAAQGLSAHFGDELSGLGAVADTVMGRDVGKSATGKKYGANESIPSYDQAPLSWRDYAKKFTDLGLKTAPLDSAGIPSAAPSLSGGLADIYSNARDKERNANKAAEAKDPVGYGLGEFAGSVALPVPGAAEAKTFGALAKAGAKVGAPLAAANYIGSSDEENPVTATGLVGNTVAGGGFGAAANGVLGKAGQWLGKRAENTAVNAIEGPAGISDRLKKEGLSDPAKKAAFGRELLNEGIIPWSGSKTTALENAQAVKGEVGKPIGEYVDNLDKEVAAQPATPRSDGRLTKNTGLDYNAMANAAQAALPNDNAVAMSAAGKGQQLADLFREQGGVTPGKYRGAWNAKMAAQKSLNFSDQAPAAQQIARDVERGARDNMKEQMLNEAFANALRKAPLPADRTPGAMGKAIESALMPEAEKFNGFNQNLHRYSSASKAEDILDNAVSREGQRAPIGLREAMMLGGALGGASHGAYRNRNDERGGLLDTAAEALGGAAAMRLGANRGYGPLARGLDAASKSATKLQAPLQTMAVPAAEHASETAWERFTRQKDAEDAAKFEAQNRGQ